MSLGAMVTDYVIDRKAAAYLPARFVNDNIDAGELHPVPNAPHFAYPIWSVWRDDTDPIIRAAGQSCLDEISQRIIAHQEKLIESIDWVDFLTKSQKNRQKNVIYTINNHLNHDFYKFF